MDLSPAEVRRRPWRVGILSGTGTALKRTIPALVDSSLCSVTVVHGRDRGRLNAVSQAHSGVRVTDDERHFAALRNSYDIVFIASPPFLHVRHLELALDTRKPVIIEKPLISRRQDLGSIEALVHRAKYPMMVAHHIRHQEAVRELRDLVRSRSIGRPLSARLRWSFIMNHDASNADWKLDPALGGSNAMFDCGIHALDLALLLFGVPCGVTAFGARVRSSGTYDCMWADLFYSDLTCGIFASQSFPASGNDLEVTFSEGLVQIPALLSEKSAASMSVRTMTGSQEVHYEPVNLYRAEVESFCRYLEGDKGYLGTTATDALAASRVLFSMEDAMTHATRTGELPVMSVQLER